jgi:hypothetical protein
VSSLDIAAAEVFGLYKGRVEVEQMFDVFKNTLEGDLLYLGDDFAVFGHLFVGFLSLFGYCVLQNLLRCGGLFDSVSPLDLLAELSLVYAVDCGEQMVLSEIPKKARILDEKLGLNLFPKNT